MRSRRQQKFVGLATIALLLTGWLLHHWLWWGADLDFQPAQGQTASASFSRHGRSYRLSRMATDGSGQYTLYTLSYRDAQGRSVEREFSTCRGFRWGTDYRLEGDRLIFFTMHDYHCGWFTTPFNELTRGPKEKTVEFNRLEP
jgi:hypothetical protein